MANLKNAGKAALETGKFWAGLGAAAAAFVFVFTLCFGSSENKTAETPKQEA